MKKANKKISVKKFDEKFDNNEDVLEHLNLKKAKLNKRVRRVNIDFPAGLLHEIDQEANKIGIARTALIKVWLAERLENAK
jgi:predicted DNA binding CopG/RHH family protein